MQMVPVGISGMQNEKVRRNSWYRCFKIRLSLVPSKKTEAVEASSKHFPSTENIKSILDFVAWMNIQHYSTKQGLLIVLFPWYKIFCCS
jgi:hypothetical protein